MKCAVRNGRGGIGLLIGIAAGLAALTGVLVAIGRLDGDDLAVWTAVMAGVFAALVPLATGRGGCGCRGQARPDATEAPERAGS